MNQGIDTLSDMHHPLPPRGSRALSVLQDGGLVLLPTANLWQLTALADEPAALRKLLETCAPTPPPELIFPDAEVLRAWCPVIHPKLDTLVAYHRRTLRLSVPAGPRVPLSLMGTNGEVVVRLAKDSFCYRLCEDLEIPLVACLAYGPGAHTLPTSFGKIRSDVLRAADYVVQRRQRETIGTEAALTVRMEGDEMVFVE